MGRMGQSLISVFDNADMTTVRGIVEYLNAFDPPANVTVKRDGDEIVVRIGDQVLFLADTDAEVADFLRGVASGGHFFRVLPAAATLSHAWGVAWDALLPSFEAVAKDVARDVPDVEWALDAVDESAARSSCTGTLTLRRQGTERLAKVTAILRRAVDGPGSAEIVVSVAAIPGPDRLVVELPHVCDDAAHARAIADFIWQSREFLARQPRQLVLALG